MCNSSYWGRFLKNTQNNHNMQINTVIKSLFLDKLKKLHETLDTFWSEYTNFNHKNDPFESDEFICSSKDICDGDSHLWHNK